jgi:biopolymer transport protein ExbB
MQNEPLGFAHFWQAGDAVTHSIAWLLLAMSIVSWYLILAKGISAWRLRRGTHAGLARFWAAGSLGEAIAALAHEDRERVFVPLAEKAQLAAQAQAGTSLGTAVDRNELVVRVLRQEMTQASARLESGLTFLASVGSTAPFIGLLGTVWGIYHALINIASSGQVMIDRVAGPVGEALIMTAAGLAVAIPAVLGYNAYTRFNRVTLAELDGFAHDLFALVTTGSRVGDAVDDSLRAAIVAGGAPIQPVGH